MKKRFYIFSGILCAVFLILVFIFRFYSNNENSFGINILRLFLEDENEYSIGIPLVIAAMVLILLITDLFRGIRVLPLFWMLFIILLAAITILHLLMIYMLKHAMDGFAL